MDFFIKIILVFIVFIEINPSSKSQSLPMEVHFSQDGRMLLTGDLPDTGLYNQSEIRTIFLNFSQPDYWQQMDSLYWTWTKEEIPATMIVDGIAYDSVGVRFKGQSSFQNIPASLKKSFSISMDFVHTGQNIMGNKSINLHNCYEDESFLREVFYESRIKNHIPAAKAAFVKLYINGENWGLYANVQQINKGFFKQWYLSAKGTSWRAERDDGQWAPDGNGTCALNYIGADTVLYQEEYDLKFYDKPNPWGDLVNTCDVLNNSPLANLPDSLPKVLDVDKTIWFLASEILFSDDDSYVEKGRQDYYFYWEKETGRIVPQEYDGNSAMNPDNIGWSPFHHEDSVNYPLMNRLFKVPEYRQRYLAHLRVLIKEYFDPSSANSIIDSYKSQIDTIVLNDPKKIYSYQDFQDEIVVLKNFIASRRFLLENNSEVAAVALVISEFSWNVNGNQWAIPAPMQPVTVRAKAVSNSGIYRVNLFYSTNLVGKFIKMQMFDDGFHNDLFPGDGIYGNFISGQPAATWVRFYVEAVANNSAKTVSYEPAGAEHNVYIYGSGITSVSENLSGFNNGIIIYPNPNKGEFKIIAQPVTAENYYKKLKIKNVLGESVFQQSISSVGTTFNLERASDFPNGIYFIELYQGEKIIRGKIIIQ